MQSLETTILVNKHTIKTDTESLDSLGKQVRDVTLQVDFLQSNRKMLGKKTNNNNNDEPPNLLVAYQRRWNL